MKYTPGAEIEPGPQRDLSYDERGLAPLLAATRPGGGGGGFILFNDTIEV
jgi:hypothetical protein